MIDRVRETSASVPRGSQSHAAVPAWATRPARGRPWGRPGGRAPRREDSAVEVPIAARACRRVR